MGKARNGVLLCSLILLGSQLAGALQNTWIATWASSPQAIGSDPDEPLLKIEDQTVRERIRVSIGGTQISIRLSNEYGSTPLLVGAVTVAVPNGPTSVKAGTVQAVTFGGHNSVTIPAGAPALSDPLAFPVSAGAEISVSLYFPKHVASPTIHGLALKRTVISPSGDFTHAEKIDGGDASESTLLLNAVLVPAGTSERLVVAFGDSITDGDGSTMEADRNWPSDLVRRLAKTPEGAKVAVVNEGIAGNRLLRDSDSFGVSGLARFERDALAQPGVTHIVLLEGINDIGFPGTKLNGKYLADPVDVRSVDELIQGYRELIVLAHAHGIRVIGGTITPFEGVTLAGYYSESKEGMRQAVNKWIRTSGSFDAVIDFDAIVRDPEHPSSLAPGLAAPDHLHPNDAGYQAIADAIDLSLFK